MHIIPNGQEKPVAFASRSLSTSEQNYSQIDKEALGLILRKRHTDHVKDVTVLPQENETVLPSTAGSKLPEHTSLEVISAAVPAIVPASAAALEIATGREDRQVSQVPDHPDQGISPRDSTVTPSIVVLKQYPARARKPPDRYQPHH